MSSDSDKKESYVRGMERVSVSASFNTNIITNNSHSNLNDRDKNTCQNSRISEK
jgi:hypothetical protein